MEQQELMTTIEKCKQNDKSSFALLVGEYQQLVFSLAFRLLCNNEDAKDATQDIFVKVWLNINKYDSSKKFSTWLHTITVNHCYDKIKKPRTISIDENIIAKFINSEDIETDYTNKELVAIISLFVHKLSKKQKLVFTLRYMEQLELDEIAEITGMNKNQIKSNMHLAIKAIKSKVLELENK